MGEIRTTVLNYIFIRDRKAYIVAAGSAPEDFDAWRGRLEKIVLTFRLE